jgi:hypothetical protein
MTAAWIDRAIAAGLRRRPVAARPRLLVRAPSLARRAAATLAMLIVIAPVPVAAMVVAAVPATTCDDATIVAIGWITVAAIAVRRVTRVSAVAIGGIRAALHRPCNEQ